MALISRRRHLRGGTRYNARGIDDQGNVANCVETEQLVRMKNISLSYVLVRGSIPVFWEQKGMIEDVTITRGPDMTAKAFHKHFDDLHQAYSKISLVDLLSDTKARETILTKEYVRQIYSSAAYKERLRFMHFDFHRYCKGDKYGSLKVLLHKLGPELHDQGFFVEDVDGRKV